MPRGSPFPRFLTQRLPQSKGTLVVEKRLKTGRRAVIGMPNPGCRRRQAGDMLSIARAGRKTIYSGVEAGAAIG